jgi:hypothetical protein
VTAGSRLRAGAVLVATGAMLVACGGASSGSSKANGTSGGAPHASSVPTSSSGSGSGGGKSISTASFCAYAKEQQQQSATEIKAFESDTPAQLEQYETNALAQLSKFASTAPTPIRSDVQLVVTQAQALVSDLKAANFDFQKLPPSDLSTLNAPKLAKASDAITTYLRTACGITVSNSLTPAS